MPTLLHKRGATAALGRTTFQVGEIAINTTLNTIIVGTGNRNSVALAKADASNFTPNFSAATTPLTLPGGSISGGGRLRYHNGEIQSSNASGVFSALSSGTASVTSITLTRYANATLLPSATVARLAWRNDVNRPVISNESGTFSFLLRDGDTFRADTCRLADNATSANFALSASRATSANEASFAHSAFGVGGFTLPIGNSSLRTNDTGDIRLNRTPAVSASNTPAINKFEGRLPSGWDFFVMESTISSLVSEVPSTNRSAGKFLGIVGTTPTFIDLPTQSTPHNPGTYTGAYGTIRATGNITSSGTISTTDTGNIFTTNANIIANRISSTQTSGAGNITAAGAMTAERFVVNGEYTLPLREAASAGLVLTAVTPTTTEFRAIPLPTAAGGNSGFIIPVGGNATRGTATRGKFRLSSENSRPEMVLSGTTWTQLLTASDVIANATNAVTAIRARDNGGFQVGSGTTVTRSASAVAGFFRHNTTNDEFEGRGNTGWTSFLTTNNPRLLATPTLADAGRLASVNAAGDGFIYVDPPTGTSTGTPSASSVPTGYAYQNRLRPIANSGIGPRLPAGGFKLTISGTNASVEMSHNDRSNSDLSGIIDGWDDSTSTVKGRLFIDDERRYTQSLYRNAWFEGNVTSLTNLRTGETVVNLSNIARGQTTPFANMANVRIRFVRSGDAGVAPTQSGSGFFTVDSDGNASGALAKSVKINGKLDVKGLEMFLDNRVETLSRSIAGGWTSGGVLPQNQNDPRQGTWQFSGGTSNSQISAITFDHIESDGTNRNADMMAIVTAARAVGAPYWIRIRYETPDGGTRPTDFICRANEVSFNPAGYIIIRGFSGQTEWRGALLQNTVHEVKISNHNLFDTDDALYSFPVEEPVDDSILVSHRRSGGQIRGSTLSFQNRYQGRIITSVPSSRQLEALPNGYRMYHAIEKREYIWVKSAPGADLGLFRGPAYTLVRT